MANEVEEVFFFPFGFICPPKPNPKPKIPTPLYVYHSNDTIIRTAIPSITGNGTDKFDPEDQYGYLVADPNVVTNVGLVLMEDDRILKLMCNPTKIWARGGIVKVRSDGQVVPAFVPMLSDLKLLPRALQVTTRWAVEKGDPEVATQKLLSMLSPSLPAHRHVAVFTGGFRSGEHQSDSNALYLFKTPLLPGNPCNLSIEWAGISSTWLDGQQYRVGLSIKATDQKPCEDVPKPNMLVVVWNCKGMTRPSFLPHLNHLIEAHNPEIFVLTEVRTAEPLVCVMLRDVNYHRLVTCDATNIVGGVVLLIMPGKVHLIPVDKLSNKFNGTVIPRL